MIAPPKGIIWIFEMGKISGFLTKYPSWHFLKRFYLKWFNFKKAFTFRLISLRIYAFKEIFFRRPAPDSRHLGKKVELILACAASEGFSFAAAAMLASVAANLKKYWVKLFFLHSDLSDSSKKKIQTNLNPGKIEIVWTSINPSFAKGLKVSEHVTKEAYYKLLLPEVLPREFQKAIYLDCDLIVREDISRLWDMGLGGLSLMAVPEMSSTGMYASSVYGVKLYETLDIKPDSRMFNSGVMILNLERWRKEETSRLVFDYLRVHGKEVVWWDQDGLNAILNNSWGSLDPGWNLQTHLIYDYSSWRASPLSKEVYYKTIKSPYIVHFNTSKKPWQKGNMHPYKDLFFYYLDKTSWKGWRP